MIIGVTGEYAAGKDAVADVLQKMNFFHVSLSDFIREEIISRNQKITRDRLIEVGNDLRKKHGASVLARRALENVKDGENYVFTSVRNPEEVKLLQERDDFVLVVVVAPDKVRLERLKKRGKAGDPKTLTEMREKAAKENTNDPAAQQLQKVYEMATITVINDKTLEVLEEKVRRMVGDWIFQLQDKRPDWDHYFMNVAEAVKLRCTCMSAKKGSVIVRDKQILSTGYNGSPKGIKHCTDGGCQRCTTRHLGKMKSGVYVEPCTCVHGEANAIIQAAYNGMATKGATLYTTFTPCIECAKLIINAGITRVVGKVIYPDDEGTKLLKAAKIKFEILKD